MADISFETGQPRQREFGVPPNLFDADVPGDYQTGAMALGINRLNQQKAKEDAVTAEVLAHTEASTQVDLSKVWDSDFNFGTVIRPRENTLLAYKKILNEGNGANNIQFSQFNYSMFDGVIVEKCGVDASGRSTHAAFNPDNKNYEDYAPLRRNIAILRNYLAVQMFHDGRYVGGENSKEGKEDAANLRKLQEMAEKLGSALAGEEKLNLIQRFGRSLKKLFKHEDLGAPITSAFLNDANIPDKGIAIMYEYLLKEQRKESWTDKLPWVKSSPRQWNLFPREQTAFSNNYMQLYSRSTRMEGIANAFETTMKELKSVDTLSNEDKTTSVDHARNILKNLRILMGYDISDRQITDTPMGDTENEKILKETIDPQQAEAQMMLAMAKTYKNSLANILNAYRNSPEDIKLILGSRELQEAGDAFEQISYRMKAETAGMLKEEKEYGCAKDMLARMDQTPIVYRPTSAVPLKVLLTKIEAGLNQAANYEKIIAGKSQSRQQEQSRPLSKQEAIQQAVSQGNATLASSHVTGINNADLLASAQRANEFQQKKPEPNPAAPILTLSK